MFETRTLLYPDDPHCLTEADVARRVQHDALDSWRPASETESTVLRASNGDTFTFGFLGRPAGEDVLGQWRITDYWWAAATGAGVIYAEGAGEITQAPDAVALVRAAENWLDSLTYRE